MKDIEALLADLEGRGIRLKLRPDGKLGAGPPEKVTNLDRVNIGRFKPDLLRLLTKRSQGHRPAIPENSDHPLRDPGLSAKDAALLDEAQRKFPGSTLEIRPGPAEGSPQPSAVTIGGEAIVPEIDREIDHEPVVESIDPGVQLGPFTGDQSPSPQPPAARQLKTTARVCPRCAYHCDDPERIHCKQCGAVLNPALRVPLEPSTPDETAPSPADTAESTPVLEPEIPASSPPEHSPISIFLTLLRERAPNLARFLEEAEISLEGDRLHLGVVFPNYLQGTRLEAVKAAAQECWGRPISIEVTFWEPPKPSAKRTGRPGSNDEEVKERPRDASHEVATSADDSEQSCDEISPPPASYEANLTDPSPPQPVDDLDHAQRLLVWATVEIVRSRRTGRPLLALKVSPSPATNTNGVRFSLEERLSSAGRGFTVFKRAADLKRGFRLVTPSAAVRLAIEVKR